MSAAQEAERNALRALSDYLTDLLRSASTLQVVAEQAGIDWSKIPQEPVRADLTWHVVQAALIEGILPTLIEAVKHRGLSVAPKNSAVPERLDALLAAALQEQRQVTRITPQPTPHHAHPDMSDYQRSNADAKIDKLQNDLADLRVQVAGLVVQVAALTDLVRKQGEHDEPVLTNAQFAAILAAFMVLASLVFAAVYYGGNR